MMKNIIKIFKRTLIITLLPSLFSLFSLTTAAAARDAVFKVGYKVVECKCSSGGRERSVAMAVWYPTVSKTAPFNYYGPANGEVAVDGEIDAKNGPYPLMVFSHGYGGSGLSSVFFTEALAARGWIVAAPDHNDADSALRIRSGINKNLNRKEFQANAKKISSSGPEDRAHYLYRVEEMKAALLEMLASEYFAKHIDKARIAVGGHSFGGFTALGLCGTLEKFKDDRIKALLLFSTGAGAYLYTEKELSSVKIPAMHILGEREREQKRGGKTMTQLCEKIFSNLSPPSYLLEIKGANHLSFNNRIRGGLLSGYLGGSPEQFAAINKYSIAFLEKYVEAIAAAEGVLKQKDPILSRYVKK